MFHLFEVFTVTNLRYWLILPCFNHKQMGRSKKRSLPLSEEEKTTKKPKPDEVVPIPLPVTHDLIAAAITTAIGPGTGSGHGSVGLPIAALISIVASYAAPFISTAECLAVDMRDETVQFIHPYDNRSLMWRVVRDS